MEATIQVKIPKEAKTAPSLAPLDNSKETLLRPTNPQSCKGKRHKKEKHTQKRRASFHPDSG
jgi:hypothetical protein